MRLRPLLALPFAVALTVLPNSADAFSTRIHIMIANQIREALIAADDGTIPLLLSDYAAELSQADFEAIRDNPLEFRAGAIGPDNMVFPGMTDPSHALGQRPFDQCELLYQAAVIPSERAYALGCFLHGATDAIAHHYVNHMSGETFTLTPISSGREQAYTNVVRHILAESDIQDAAYTLDNDAFTTGKLLYTIPIGFVLRTYLDQDSPLWQLMAEHALAEYTATKASLPNASLPTIVAAMDVGPADHLVLTPVYLAEIDTLVAEQEAFLAAEIADMQDHGSPDGSNLLVEPGDDGELGTEDDETDCTLTCPTLYATYFTYIGLLAPRYDAMGNELPSAFEKITDELRDDLLGFHPAYLATVGNVSAEFNTPLTGTGGGFDLDQTKVELAFEPLETWADDLSTIDYDTLVYAVVPDWITDLDTALQSVGLDVDISGIVAAVFQPIVQPIEDAIHDAFIGQAKLFLTELSAEYEASADAIGAEYAAKLAAAASPELDGDVLDHFYESGLYVHAFNITAAALANHAVVLPIDAVGPASFDASYTPAWMQAGVCPYLADEVFPLGIDMQGSLSVRLAGVDYPAVIDTDSPIECHDGSLSMFTDSPAIDTCEVTDLASLLDDPLGSLSRAYPPEFSGTAVECEGLVVPGLPEPPPGDGDGDSSDTDGSGEDGDGETDSADGDEIGTGPASNEDSGCACTASEPSDTGIVGFVGFAAIALLGLGLRRRRTVAVSLALLPLGCGDSASESDAGDDIGDTTDADSSSSDDTTADGDTTTGDTTDTTGDTTGDGDGDGDGDTSLDSELLALLDGTVWHGEALRDGKLRGFELEFDSASLLWSEIRNPFGPARLREMRAFSVDEDGLTAHSTVISPQGWPIHPENGRMDDWALEVIDGNPRILRTTREGITEEFEEGAWPVPTEGLTATVRVFEVGGVVDQAFCDSGANGFDYAALFDFAIGQSDEIVETDVVAGAALTTWTDPTNNNQFSITDVAGFDQLGGTELSDSFNFFVTYTGTLDHPGGELSMREQDDSVEDAVWVFLADGVGSDNVNDLFLEVHGFIWADGTADEPSAVFAGGELPIQAVLVRCTEQITDVDVEVNYQGSGWELVGDVASTPEIDNVLFPPAL